MRARRLKRYEEALTKYHLHPEAEFHDGDYLDHGVTCRRHIAVTALDHIGKEANRSEEQFYVGLDHEAQTDYGLAPEDAERIVAYLRVACEQLGQRAVAKTVRSRFPNFLEPNFRGRPKSRYAGAPTTDK